MPSTFESEFSASAAPEMMDAFGRSATYKPTSGSEINDFKVRIIGEQPAKPEEDENKSSFFNRTAILKVQAADVAAPAKDGRFTVDGVVWTVTSLPVLRNGQWIMDVETTATDRMNEQRVKRG